MTSPSKSYLLSNPEHFERESKRLEIQAEGMLNRELAAISNFSSCKAKVVLDLGCGNGFALELISEKLKGAIVHGIDRNPALIEQAKQNCTRAEFSCIDLTDIERLATAIKTISPDLIFLRYVVQHLSKNEYISLFSTLLINKGPSATVIIVDTDDRLCSFSPASPDAMALLEAKQRLQNHEGGDRTIGSNLLAPLTEIGYAFVERNVVTVSSKDMGLENWKSIFWPVIRSGGKFLESSIESKLTSNAERWFASASRFPHYEASFSVIVTVVR